MLCTRDDFRLDCCDERTVLHLFRSIGRLHRSGDNAGSLDKQLHNYTTTQLHTDTIQTARTTRRQPNALAHCTCHRPQWIGFIWIKLWSNSKFTRRFIMHGMSCLRRRCREFAWNNHDIICIFCFVSFCLTEQLKICFFVCLFVCHAICVRRMVLTAVWSVSGWQTRLDHRRCGMHALIL